MVIIHIPRHRIIRGEERGYAGSLRTPPDSGDECEASDSRGERFAQSDGCGWLVCDSSSL